MSLQVLVRRLAVSVTAAALLAALGSLLHAQVTAVNNPPVAPHSILVFPQRDFVSASGFAAGDLVTVEVFHPGGARSGVATNVPPQDDPATPQFDGIVEVNHPGGACWEGQTPDIRPGDVVQTTAVNSSTGVTTTVIDATTVANVVAQRPIQVAFDTVEIHGTAQDALGRPIDITQLEQRLVAPRDAFDLNGRRTLRAVSAAGGGDGSLSYDAVGGTAWTATYRGLDAADVTRALNAESRILWLGSNPGAAVESTVYEIGAGIVPGPAAPCTAPLEKLSPLPGTELVAPSAPTNITATLTGSNTVSLNWSASTDNVGVTSYGIYRNGVAIANVENPDGSAPAPTHFEDFNLPPGTYTYTVDAADAVGNRSAQVGTQPAQVTATKQVANPQLPRCTGTPTADCVSDPPAATPTQVQIIAFPARDFTSSSGYTEQDSTVAVQVIRDGFLISSATVIPQDDPTTVGFDGIVEVNHPGGGCWTGVTPDLRPGDIVRQIAYAADGTTIRRVDQTHVANISVERPRIVQLPTSVGATDGIIEVHGTAMDADGNPIAAANVTQRLVANRDAFDFNGRRTLRAGGAGKDGTFAYDTVDNPNGIKFTATYSGLDENDVYRAVGGTTSTGRTFPGAESRILWLADPTVVAPGMTIYENSDLTISGPAAGACTAPIEPLDTQAPSTPAPTAEAVAGTMSVKLTWSPSTDDSYVAGYGIYRDGIRIRNVGGTLAPGTTVFTFVDQNVPAGDHTYAVDAVDSASPLKLNYPPIPNDPNAGDPIMQGVAWGNRSAQGIANAISQGDVTPPTTPANLVGVVQADGVHLTWVPSTDDVGVTAYTIYRNNVAIGTTPSANFTDAVLNGTYTYAVDASDAAGNRSAQSSPVTVIVTGTADTTAPTQPASLVADTRDVYSAATAPAIGPKDVKLAWQKSTDNTGVAGYGIYRRSAASLNPTAAFTKIADVNGSTLTFTDLNVPLGTYDYTVDATDSAGNRSAVAAPALDVTTVNDPPQGTHSIIPFPQRDFVSSTGYAVSEGPVVINVIRNGKLWARSTPIPVAEDPATPGLGAVEVNHPGGGCWNPATLNGLPGITPDLRPGDIVRFTNKSGVADQTTVANVYADRATDRGADGSFLAAGMIQTHGTAQDASGNPLPLASVESRLVASSANPFSVNGRRVLRAGGAGSDGTLTYDPVGPNNPKGLNWTATFTGLSASDVDLAKGAESRAVWLGRDPLALTELTIFENGDGVVGGPAAGQCTAPAEAGPAVAFQESAPFSASFDPFAQAMSFPRQSTGTSVSQTLILTNVGTSDAARGIAGTLSIAAVALEMSGDFQITSNSCAATTAPTTVLLNDSCAVGITFTPKAPGQPTARLLFKDDANNSPVQVIALSGEAFDGQAPTVTAPTQSFVTRRALTANTVLANVMATASDPSGIGSMVLEQSTDGGRSWAQVPSPTIVINGTTAQITATVSQNLSATYQFRASATDLLGNQSAPVAAPSVRMSLTDDSAGTPRFNGSWSAQKNNNETAGTIGNTLHIATAPQPGKSNTATLTFTGSEIALVSSLGPDRGAATISVDGGSPQAVDLYAASLQKATVVGTVSGLSAGTHTVTITVLDATRKNPSSSGTRVDVDAFLVRF